MLVLNIIVGIYVFGLMLLIIGWFLDNKSYLHIGENMKKGVVISVIVPVRNEEKNIFRLLESIKNQTLALDSFEVIVVDDNSTDGTLVILEAYHENNRKLNLKVLQKCVSGGSPKKEALELAINEAVGDHIFTTDGDCALPPTLLQGYCAIFENEDVKMISGPVTFFKPEGRIIKKLWQHIQTVEFASLVGTAAVAIFYKKPNMCSGANLAFRKSVFLEVHGYEGNKHLASGDDEFLMHKVFAKYKSGLIYAKSSSYVVSAEASENLKGFYNQRKRWASKWASYEDIVPSILAIFVFIANLSFCVLMLSFGFNLLFAIKVFLEFIFLSLVLNMLGRRASIAYIVLVQIIYPFYVCFFAINQLLARKSYVWKDRELK